MIKITENSHPISVHIPKDRLEIIDKLALLYGVKRTVMLRFMLFKGLTRALRAYPDLAARYQEVLHTTYGESFPYEPDMLGKEGTNAPA
jgi:hypothetical protein